MRFLVRSESVDAGPVVPPQQSAQVIEQLVLPSLRMLAQWEQEGKGKGGSLVGQRAGAFVLEADSPEQANAMLSSLPFWGITKWTVEALVPAQTSIQQAEQQLEHLRRMMSQTGEQSRQQSR